MSLQIGITGLSQSGKSTFFKALTSMSTAGGTGTSKKVNLARVPVPDDRVWDLARRFNPRKVTPAVVDFVDMPGGTGGGLSPKVLAEIRTATVLVEVVRCFEHPYLGLPDPVSDMETFELELLLADLKIVEGKLERKKKLLPLEKQVLERLYDPLEQGRLDLIPELEPEELKAVSGLGLLCLKPRIYFANLPEDGGDAGPVHEFARARNTESIEACALLEAEIAELEEGEKEEFLRELGVRETGLEKLVKAGYKRLGLISFFTVGDDEVRAWECREGSTAPQAAGVIHSDMERGFIRAEVIDYDMFVACGSLAEARSLGKVRVEGKHYVVRDGDIINVRFNV